MLLDWARSKQHHKDITEGIQQVCLLLACGDGFDVLGCSLAKVFLVQDFDNVPRVILGAATAAACLYWSRVSHIGTVDAC